MPSAIGRSNRPPSLGRSAGARFTVIRPAGNSKRELSSAARTRSLLSFTTVAGRPTMQKAGRPLARLTSTCTRGACSPTSARQATRATDITDPAAVLSKVGRALAPAGIGTRCGAGSGRRGSRALERGEARLELFEAGAGALEHPRLGVELVPRHQVELAQ